MRSLACRILISILLLMLLDASEAFAETPDHELPHRELGLNALVVGFFTPSTSIGGLAMFVDVLFPVNEELCIVIAVGGGPLVDQEEMEMLGASHAGIRWMIHPEHAVGVRAGVDLILIPEEHSPIADYALGGDVEYVYRFSKHWFLLTSVGAGAAWPQEDDARTSIPQLQMTWMNGVGTELTAF